MITELLAPARTAEVGIEAFRHGADAVYIGAPMFSARAAAGNSVADIERLAAFGHQYGAHTMVALNTILTDAELSEAERLVWQLYEAGVDALIVQDLGLLDLHLPPIELHASTQTDNRTAEKVRLMRDLGMARVVLARELTVAEIAAIHAAVPDVELECFVHGALCVSYSGQCYMSAALTGRSANRGTCSQPCRLPVEMYSPDGATLLAGPSHLLSLRDMNRSAQLEALLDAGVTSLKIEGRLKEVGYVKNVVAYYRRLLDDILERRPDVYRPLSYGRCEYTFDPAPAKSFNRGFTPYFADGQRAPMWNFASPKSVGERIGEVAEVGGDSFRVRLLPGQELHNGDGLASGALGFRLNRYEAASHTVFPLDGRAVCRQLHRGQSLWRNLDTAFEQQLAKPSAQRRLAVAMQFVCEGTVARLEMRATGRDAAWLDATVSVEQQGPFDLARQSQRDNIVRQCSRLGETPFVAARVEVTGEEYFVPSSVLADMRRSAVAQLLDLHQKMQTAARKMLCAPDYANRAETISAKGVLPTDFRANVHNGKARGMYARMGLDNVAQSYETQPDTSGSVMQTRHCLKYAFGQCPRYPNPHPEKLLIPNHKLGSEVRLQIGGKKFLLKFGCKNDCVSEIFTIFAPSKLR